MGTLPELLSLVREIFYVVKRIFAGHSRQPLLIVTKSNVIGLITPGSQLFAAAYLVFFPNESTILTWTCPHFGFRPSRRILVMLETLARAGRSNLRWFFFRWLYSVHTLHTLFWASRWIDTRHQLHAPLLDQPPYYSLMIIALKNVRRLVLVLYR